MVKISNIFMRARPAPAPRPETPTDLSEDAVTEISRELNWLLADTFALYIKTKNFHWHVSGPHFRSYHLLFDEHARELSNTTDELAERVRKIGGTTLRSVAHIGRLQKVQDNEQEFVAPLDMLRELMSDTMTMITAMRGVHEL